MTRLDIYDVLKESLKVDPISSCDVKGEVVQYLPVISQGELDLGITRDNNWVVGDREKVFHLNSGFHAAPALPFLKTPISDMLNNVRQLGLTESSFPFREFVRIGLRQRSQYWAELAFAWCVLLPDSEKKELVDELNEITSAKWTDQKFRNKVKKEIKKIKS